jgi:integrase
MANGSYQATVYVGRDANDKMLRKYITRDGFKECKDAARELEQKIAENDITNASLMRFDAYADKWFSINKPRLAPTTIKAYNTYIKVHFKPFFGKLKVHQITNLLIEEYIAEKLEDHSSTTIRKHFFTLSKMLYDALKTKSPCIGIKPPPNAPFKPYVPSEAEFQIIHETFKEISLEDEIIILLAGECGLRRGEIFAIKLDDIDEKNGTIRIDEAVALEEDSYKFETKLPKSLNGIRTVIVSDYLMGLIKEFKKSKKSISQNLFTYNPHTFTKKYIKIRKEKNLPHVRFHDLRHYHASLLYKYNVPDQYAADRLGHDIWVLKKIYQHLGLEEHKELDEKVRDILNKPK